MCGRFTQERPTSDLARIFGARDLADDPGGHFNVAPTNDAAVIVQHDGERAVVRYRWGLVPHWDRDGRQAARRINARAETVGTLPAFRDAFARRRCLVPVDSFYEWRREGPVRQPYRVVRSDGQPLVLAGLWAARRHEDEPERVLRTFTIVTTTPSRRIAALHDRMPVILPDSAWATWLDPDPDGRSELRSLLVPAESVPLDIHPVRRLVNDVRNDGPDLVAVATDGALSLPPALR